MMDIFIYSAFWFIIGAVSMVILIDLMKIRKKIAKRQTRA